jgi:hypothetical protein
MFRLYLEWARLVSPKRGLMDFEFTTEPVFVTPPSGPSATERKVAERKKVIKEDPLEKLRVARPGLKKRDPEEEKVVEETL